MNLLSPTVTLNESSIRCRIACPGLLLLAAIAGSALTIMAVRRRSANAAPETGGPRTTESRLREVEELLEQALISDAERVEARLRILGEI